MISNQVVTLVTWRKPTKKNEKKKMRISIHSEIVYQQEYLRRIRESLALVKLLLNKYLLNITGMEGETKELRTKGN